MASATATLAWQPVDGSSIRLESRHDQAADALCFAGAVEGDGASAPFVPDARAQDTITLGAVAWF